MEERGTGTSNEGRGEGIPGAGSLHGRSGKRVDRWGGKKGFEDEKNFRGGGLTEPGQTYYLWGGPGIRVKRRVLP